MMRECPFCGSTAEVVEGESDVIKGTWCGFCVDCGASGPIKQSADDAISGWNKRATNAELDGD